MLIKPKYLPALMVVATTTLIASLPVLADGEISSVRKAAIEKLQKKLGTIRGSIKPDQRHIYLTPGMIEKLKPITPYSHVIAKSLAGETPVQPRQPMDTAPIYDQATVDALIALQNATQTSPDFIISDAQSVSDAEIADIIKNLSVARTTSAPKAPVEVQSVRDEPEPHNPEPEVVVVATPTNTPVKESVFDRAFGREVETDTASQDLKTNPETTAIESAPKPLAVVPVRKTKSTQSKRAEILRSLSKTDNTVTHSVSKGTLPNTSDIDLILKAVDAMVEGHS